jgi:hypothetical protein
MLEAEAPDRTVARLTDWGTPKSTRTKSLNWPTSARFPIRLQLSTRPVNTSLEQIVLLISTSTAALHKSNPDNGGLPIEKVD